MTETELMQHVAGNPDGCDVTDLKSFVDYVGNGDKPLQMASCIFTNEMVKEITDYKNGDRLQATILIRDYCRRSIKARHYREKGYVNRAISMEQLNETIYKSLPEWAKW